MIKNRGGDVSLRVGNAGVAVLRVSRHAGHVQTSLLPKTGRGLGGGFLGEGRSLGVLLLVAVLLLVSD